MSEFVFEKLCSECGKTKPVSKFHKHPTERDGYMKVCKWCRNGGQELAARHARESLDRQFGDPTEDQIAALCLKLRLGWSEKETRKRKDAPWFWRKLQKATG